MENFLTNLKAGFESSQITAGDVLVVLLMVAVLALYQFIIYRFVSKRSFYSKSFNIAMAVIPFFVATIIMTLQTNMIITLGTIGALAIIRFRTAIKDPMDMVYLFWSVHTGIVCGTGLYLIGVITSLVVTLFILLLEVIPLGKSPFLLVINADSDVNEDELLSAVTKLTSYRRIKSRNYSKSGLDMIIEVRTSNEMTVTQTVGALNGVYNVALIAHDSEDVI